MKTFAIAVASAALLLCAGAVNAKPVHHKATSQASADAKTADLNRQQLANAVNSTPGTDTAQTGSTTMPATGSDATTMSPPANTPDAGMAPSNTGAVGTSTGTNGDQSPATGQPMGGVSTQSSQPDNTNTPTPAGK